MTTGASRGQIHRGGAIVITRTKIGEISYCED